MIWVNDLFTDEICQKTQIRQNVEKMLNAAIFLVMCSETLNWWSIVFILFNHWFIHGTHESHNDDKDSMDMDQIIRDNIDCLDAIVFKDKA